MINCSVLTAFLFILRVIHFWLLPGNYRLYTHYRQRCCVVVLTLWPRLLQTWQFNNGHFLTIYKTAQVPPVLRKPGLDVNAKANYHPISNLPTISEVLDRLALLQLRPCLLQSSNFTRFESAYRQRDSTVTAPLRALTDIHSAAAGP